jgi:hypothetical protein
MNCKVKIFSKIVQWVLFGSRKIQATLREMLAVGAAEFPPSSTCFVGGF